jgi:hypothetical protein
MSHPPSSTTNTRPIYTSALRTLTSPCFLAC